MSGTVNSFVLLEILRSFERFAAGLLYVRREITSRIKKTVSDETSRERGRPNSWRVPKEAGRKSSPWVVGKVFSLICAS